MLTALSAIVGFSAQSEAVFSASIVSGLIFGSSMGVAFVFREVVSGKRHLTHVRVIVLLVAVEVLN